MEKQLKNLLPQRLELPKTQNLAAYEGVLTDEEIIALISNAAERKLAKQREVEYWEKVNNPPKPESVTSDKLLSIIMGKAKSEIADFILTKDEELVYNLLSLYFTETPDFESFNDRFSLKKGILLFGNIGCGKTTAMNLFRANPKQSYAVIATRKITGEYTKKDGGGVEAIEKYFGPLYSAVPNFSFGHKELGVCFDDLGTETSVKHMGNETNVMSEIILNRYDNELGKGFKTHITTNLTVKEIEEYYGKRVLSRMKEMFNLIEFPETAKDKRK